MPIYQTALALVTVLLAWAEASVGPDQFRLIRFEERWRFVSIRLCQGPVSVMTDRTVAP